MIDQAQRRLWWALAASVTLHIWLVQSGEGSYARWSTTSAHVRNHAPITATLSAPPPLATPQSIAPEAAYSRVAERPAVPSQSAPGRLAPEQPQPAQSRPAVAPLPAVTLMQAQAAPPSLPGDSTYYTARNLDVYPRALTALQLGFLPRPLNVRATVLIDETGTVNEVRSIEAGSAEVETAVRELLLRTRFTPARKDGRLVRAQVLISFD